MTNEQIIFNAEQNLAGQGKIKYTGNLLEFQTMDGQTVEVMETERIHTFQAWKEAGFVVRKGQKAVCKLRIWKYTAAEKNKDGKKIQQVEGKMFMKEASFFSASQVEKITA